MFAVLEMFHFAFSLASSLALFFFFVVSSGVTLHRKKDPIRLHRPSYYFSIFKRFPVRSVLTLALFLLFVAGTAIYFFPIEFTYYYLLRHLVGKGLMLVVGFLIFYGIHMTRYIEMNLLTALEREHFEDKLKASP